MLITTRWRLFFLFAQALVLFWSVEGLLDESQGPNFRIAHGVIGTLALASFVWQALLLRRDRRSR